MERYHYRLLSAISSVGRAPIRFIGGPGFESLRSRTMKKVKILWKDKLGTPECTYVERWVIDFFGYFSIRLHHWLKSDDTRHYHDHAWDFLSFVLWGSLVDRTENGDELRKWLSFKFFKAEHRHMVVIDKPCWTILLCGPERRVWGYWVKNRFRKRNKYFFEKGHHDPC